MQYLGIDVHSKASVWCLLNEVGEQVETGQTPTSGEALRSLAARIGRRGPAKAAQEAGTQCYLVHDAFDGTGVPLLTFHPNALRVIAASRKKTDRRDAFWLAKTLQTGMHPHPVYIPTGALRDLRGLLAQRAAVLRDRLRWHLRAKSRLRSCGHTIGRGYARLRHAVDELGTGPDGVSTSIHNYVEMCQWYVERLDRDVRELDQRIREYADGNDDVQRLRTIPGIGPITAALLVAHIGDISRFPSAKSLASYAGLVPTVRQSGGSEVHGRITKLGPGPLRAALVQAAQTIVNRSQSGDAEPLQAFYDRIRGSRGRRKIAIVALARHILRVSYYVLRDKEEFNPARLRNYMVA